MYLVRFAFLYESLIHPCFLLINSFLCYTFPLINLVGGGRQGWIFTFAIFWIFGAIFWYLTFKNTKERIELVANEATQSATIKDKLKSLLVNKYSIITTLVIITFFFTNGLITGATIYYSEYVLQSTWISGVLVTVFQGAQLVGFIFVGVIFLIGHFIRGFGISFVSGLMYSLLADTIEYGEWKTGLRNEGLVNSGGSMGIKIGSGFGTAFIGWILARGSYIANQTEQTSSAIFSINALFIYLNQFHNCSF